MRNVDVAPTFMVGLKWGMNPHPAAWSVKGSFSGGEYGNYD